MHLPLAAQLSVKCNCKTVRFVLYPGNQPETFRVAVNRKFSIIKIQSSRFVIVIFYHSTHRNMQMKLFQYFQCYIHLPPSSVHHDQIRKYLKASGFTFFLLFTQSMPESSGQYFIPVSYTHLDVYKRQPHVSASDVKPKGFTTFVYADDGSTEIERFVSSGSNRVYKSVDEIPKDLQHAFVAIEDERFYKHNGCLLYTSRCV